MLYWYKRTNTNAKGATSSNGAKKNFNGQVSYKEKEDERELRGEGGGGSRSGKWEGGVSRSVVGEYDKEIIKERGDAMQTYPIGIIHYKFILYI